MLGEINRLRKMSVVELQREWECVFGSPARTTNQQHLWRRLAWELQARAHGGLSDRAKHRLVELAQDIVVRAPVPNVGGDVAARTPTEDAPRPVRDIRLPSPGTVLTRQYHGREIRVTTLDDGFEWDGRRYGSLSEVARAVTGQHWSGPLFFGLRKRSGRA